MSRVIGWMSSRTFGISEVSFSSTYRTTLSAISRHVLVMCRSTCPCHVPCRTPTRKTSSPFNANQRIGIQEVAHVLAANSRLWRLWVVDNPLTHIPKYRDEVRAGRVHFGLLSVQVCSDPLRPLLCRLPPWATPYASSMGTKSAAPIASSSSTGRYVCFSPLVMS